MLHKHSKEKVDLPTSFYSNYHKQAPLDFEVLASGPGHLSVSSQKNCANINTLATQTNKYSIPNHGLPQELAYNLIHNELTLDGNPVLNLASFVNTFTTEFANKLIQQNINKNLADNDEYPQLIELNNRCISMLSQLWKCNDSSTPLGCATTGSSEAIMLGGLAMKRQWEKKMKEAGKDYSKPNIIMSSSCQVALEKFARYFDVECRLVPGNKESGYHLDPNSLWDYVDENTIGCFVILGTTYTGHLESVGKVSDVLKDIESENPTWSNLPIQIHVDGASGGFLAPFAFDDSQLKRCGLDGWGFDNPRVVSINTSGHKFGLTTAGLGWIVWRDESYLLQELRFKLKYLGGIEETFNLNFSRSGFQVIHQYYNFLSLGHNGYREIFQKSLFVARTFAMSLLNHPGLENVFEVVSCIHEGINNNSIPEKASEYWTNPSDYKPGIPLCAFKLSKNFQDKYPEIPQAMVSSLLRSKGWIVPNYPLPKSTDDTENWEVLRVVFRMEMRLDLAQLLIKDIHHVIMKLVKVYDVLSDQTLYEEKRSHSISQMLTTLAMSDDAFDEPMSSSHVNKNYRGTC